MSGARHLVSFNPRWVLISMVTENIDQLVGSFCVGQEIVSSN